MFSYYNLFPISKIYNTKIFHFSNLIMILILLSCSPEKNFKENIVKPKNLVKKNKILESSRNNIPKSKTDSLILEKITIKKLKNKQYDNVLNLRRDYKIQEKDSINNDEIVFEFKKERVLHGYERKKVNKDDIKKETAIKTAFKMLKKIPSTDMEILQFDKSYRSQKPINYGFLNYLKYKSLEKNNYKALVMLPLDGVYKKIGTKLRQSLELSLLEEKNSNIDLLFYDTSSNNFSRFEQLIYDLKPSIIIGPLLRENLLKIKNISKLSKIPIISFTNDNSLSDDNTWVVGFSPDQQIKELIDYSKKCKRINFAFLGINDNYGKVVHELIKKNINSKSLKISLFLSKEELEDKISLDKKIEKFTADIKIIQENPNLEEQIQSIFLIGDRNFILQTMPMLSYHDLDIKKIDLLSTTTLNEKILINEHSLINAKFPEIRQNKKNLFENKWSVLWSDTPDFLSRLGYDITKIVIWISKNKLPVQKAIDLGKNKFIILGNKFKFLKNGQVIRPTSIVSIDSLGKLKTLSNCE